MTIVTTTKDVEGLTLTLIAEFDASPDRVWEFGRILGTLNSGGTTDLPSHLSSPRLLRPR